MRIASITRSKGEASTYRILDDHLHDRGYKILAAVRLQDVLRTDPGDRPDSYSDTLYFRQAHLDFVVCRLIRGQGLLPIFAVEFDGQQHETDPAQQRRDRLKNAFCVRAGLPLVRITSEQVVDHERVPLLAFMIERFVAWGREHEAIWSDCRRRLSELPPDDPILAEMMEGPVGFLDPEFDPAFWFNIRHPYPPTLTIQKRLAKRGVFTLRTAEERDRYIAQHGTGSIHVIHDISRSGNADNRERWSVETTAHLIRQRIPLRDAVRISWDGVTGDDSQAVQTMHSSRESVSLKWACRTGLFRRNRIGVYEELSFCDLPGVHIPDLAEQLAEYLAIKGIENWLNKRAA